jgi:GAF domain-containing protein
MDSLAILQFTENQLQQSKNNPIDKLNKICEHLRKNIDYYDWVGFYFHHQEKPKLILKAFAGAPTEHTEIPFGKGICGQVAESNANFRVDDVNDQKNYIACNIETKSELVVPLFVDGQNIGQIDIDSHQKNAFSTEDEELLKKINELVSGYINLNAINA